MFLTMGNGGVTWALQFVDSGYTALLISTQPLILIIMMWFLYKTPLSLKTIIGIGLGMIGIYLLVYQQDMVVRKNHYWGVLVIFGCLLTWGYASLFVKNADLPKSYLFNSAIQMLSGGFFLLLFSLCTENVMDVNLLELKDLTYISMAVLIIFGSVVAFTSFNYLLQHVSPEKVSTSTYVNPIVAMFLGYWFRDEVVTQVSIIAALILITGVYFINSRKTDPTT